MIIYVKDSTNEVRELKVNESVELKPLSGEQYYLIGVDQYFFTLSDNGITLNINIIDNNSNQITVELQNFIELIGQNNGSLLGISTNEDGDQLIDSVIHNPNFETAEIIQSLQDSLSLDGTTVAKGVIIDSFQAILDDLDAAAGGEVQDTAYNLPESEEDEEDQLAQSELENRPDSPDSSSGDFDRSESDLDQDLAAPEVNLPPEAVDDIETISTVKIDIENSSFEQSSLKDGRWDRSVDGWTHGDKEAGDWNPKEKSFASEEVTGENVAYIQSGGAISQVLDETLQEDNIYTLNVDMGNRADVLGGSSYSINLYAGDTLMKTVNQDNFPLENGNFITTVLSLDTSTLPESFTGYGEPLKIEVVNDNIGKWKHGQISVDNVSMTRTGLNMYTTDEENAIIVDVLKNDSDPEGSRLFITEIQGQRVVNGNRVDITDANGETIGIARVVNNQIEFTPGEKLKEMNNEEDQVVSFQYGVSDGNTSVNANVSINVTGIDRMDDLVINGNLNKQTIDTGLDDDTIEVSKSVNRSNIDMGEDNDTLSVAKNISRSDIDMGEGDDLIDVDRNIIRSDIDMGEGDDKIEVDGSIGKSNIDLGEGDDQLIVNGSIGKGTEIDAGEGDDTISVGKSIKGSIDGGEGEDTLAVDMKTIRLDKLDSQIDNIEKIDLENGKNQKLTLDADSVVKVTSNGNYLELVGEDGDIVSLKGDGWTKATDTTTSQHYTNTNGANLYIDNDIEVEELF